MANRYTDLATLQNSALTDFSKAPNLRSYGGDVRHLDVSITVTGSTDDPIYLARLPVGARLLPQLCSVDYEDPGDALTGKIGHLYDDGTGDDDAYGAALALGGSAGRKTFSEAGTKGAAFLAPVKLAKEGWIVFTPTTATSPVSAKQTWHLAYTLA